MELLLVFLPEHNETNILQDSTLNSKNSNSKNSKFEFEKFEIRIRKIFRSMYYLNIKNCIYRITFKFWYTQSDRIIVLFINT